MCVATMPSVITDSITLPPDTPYTVVSRGSVDELEFRSRIVIQHAARAGKLGYRVGILGQEGLFCETLEEALRRIIYLLGLEGRDVLIFDTVPGVLMDGLEDEEEPPLPGVPGPHAA